MAQCRFCFVSFNSQERERPKANLYCSPRCGWKLKKMRSLNRQHRDLRLKNDPNARPS